jgi:hypothetical protein
MATTYPAKQRKKQHELEDATYNCVSVRYLESVTESKAEPIEDIRRIVERVLAKSDIELALEVLSAELVDQLTGR